MSILIDQFNAGWIPSDDQVKGRRNGMLEMNNVELDQNGALVLQGGTAVKNTGYPANAHTYGNTYVGGSYHDYLLLTNGGVYRDTTLIGSGGDGSNGAIGTAFAFTLLASGAKKLKDSGSVAVNLGVLPPTAAPTITQSVINAPYAILGDVANNTVTPLGTSTTPTIGGDVYLQMTTGSIGVCQVQTYNGTGAPHNANVLQGVGGAANVGVGQDTDVIIVQGYTPNPSQIVSLRIDFLLAAGDNIGTQVSDYYTTDLTQSTANFDPATGVFTYAVQRSTFARVGSKALDWSTVYGFRLTLVTSIVGVVVNILGSYRGQTNLLIFGGSRTQNGDYQYAQVFVNNTGSYLAKSVLGPIGNLLTINNNQALVTGQDPTSIDSQVNEIWIYRKGGNLDKWYRVLVILKAAIGTPVYDTLSDQDALTLNITINLNLISIQSVTDKIYDIIGPINGRWYFFTEQFMYPSDINDPDLVDASLAIRTSSSASELYMWARKLSDGLILVGTSVDVYALGGTFATFPDGSIDIFYKPMSVKFPPLTCDADVWGARVFYMAADGWRSLDEAGSNPLMVSPNTDRLYRGDTILSYGAVSLRISPRSTRFPIVIAKNKMWCFVSGNVRIEIWDFLREYWRPCLYGLGDASAACPTPDGKVLAFFVNDRKTREIGIPSSKLIDGATKQSVLLRWVAQDGGTPYQRKEVQTAKFRGIADTTGGGTLALFLQKDSQGGPTSIGAILPQSIQVGTEQVFDLGVISAINLGKLYQVAIAGSCVDFSMQSLMLEMTERPIQVTFLKVLNQNFGNGSKKRIRNWPFVMDSLGTDTVRTDFVDDAAQTPVTFNSSTKKTFNSFFITDVFGVDYGFTLHNATGFEFFEALPPEIVQTLPIAKRFDQVGPEEFFRYGKIIQMELRIFSFGTTLPYTIYFQDASVQNGNLTVVANVEDSYFIKLPKGTSGHIARITFGPTAFDFHRYYVRLQVADSGSDTELKWVNV